MPKCRACGEEEKSPEAFFIRKGGYIPPLCKEHEREAAKLRRRASYADALAKVDIQNQNAEWRSKNSVALAERFRERYANDSSFRSDVLLRNKSSRDTRVPSRTSPIRTSDGKSYPTVLDFIREVREAGYFPPPEDLSLVYARLCKSKASDPLPQSNVGLDYLDSVFPGRYEAKTEDLQSFKDAFNDDAAIMDVIKYLAKEGRLPDRQSIIRNLKFRYRMPSHFFPDSAAAIVSEYAKGSDVFDPMLGWGGRTLGAICAGAASITGTDLQVASVDGCRRVVRDMASYHTLHGSFHNCGFSDYMSSTDSRFDLILTSPPFLDTEDYGVGRSGTSESWVKSIVLPLCSLSRRILRDGGRIAIHAQDRPKAPVLSLVLAAFSGAGYTVEREFKYGRRPGQKILVFRP